MARLHVPAARLGGASLTLEGDDHKYLARVLRLAPGDTLSLFDGAGGEVEARVTAVGSRSTTLALGARRTVATPRARLWLLVALAKGEKVDLVVQKTTELGVARVSPVQATRSVARAEGEGRLARWQTIAREAARQCGRADVPDVDPPCALAEALGRVPQEATRLVLHERARGEPLRRALRGDEPAVAVLVGPEGGWTEAELDLCVAAGFRPVGVGPRILRAETAAIAAVTLVQAALGALDG